MGKGKKRRTMTANEMVMRLTPARKAAAPTMAKIPGLMPPMSCPTSLPNKAPASSAGMMTPEGTLMPKVIVVSTSLASVPCTNQPTYDQLTTPPACCSPSFRHTHSSLTLSSPQSTSNFLTTTSPISRTSGFGNCTRAVTATTMATSNTGYSLITPKALNHLAHRKFALQNNPPNTPPATPSNTKTK